MPSSPASRTRAAPASPAGRLASPIAASILACTAAASVLALADLIQSAIRTTAPRVDAADFAIAGLHLLALYVAAGVVAGSAIGLVASLARSVRGARALLERAGTRAFWTRPDPAGVAGAIATLVAAAGLAAFAAAGHVVAVARFHRPDLAGYLLGAATLAAALVLGWVRAGLAIALRPRIASAGRAGTRAVLALVALALAIAGTTVFLVLHPEIRLAYDPVALAWLPASLVAFLLASVSVGRLARRASPARAGAAALAAIVLGLGALYTSAVTFGGSNRVRSVVEQRSVFGRRAIRLLAPLTDRDGDRYSWAFGGGDCDDSNPDVHPGAIDPPGDGIDQDCFGGDGAPIVVERSRGQYGAVPAGLQRPNFLVVTIDALRRDHLGVNGYPRPTSPNIDTFAASAVDFAGVVPQSSRSIRAIPAMWSGNYASEVAYGPEYLWPSLLPENVLAPELLRDRAGYRTSVIMATDYFERLSDFFQGFESVTQSESYDPPRDQAVNRAIPELRRLHGTGAPWLLWVHLFNCHAPYLQDGVPSRFGTEQIDLYDTELIFADEQFQRLLDVLGELGVEDRTVVVLASDHGEGFGEHGTFGHSTTLYEEELRSVLMLRIPGVAPRRIEEPVGLLDLGPTLTNLARVELPEDVSGLSLLPFATGERAVDPERPIFAELLPDGLTPYDIKVLRRGQRKLMWWVRDGTYQYFDLANDPSESHDLSDREVVAAHEMLGDLRSWVARASRAENRSETFVEQNRLRAVPADITHPVDIRYPGFTIVGFDLPQTRFVRGQTIPLTFYYRVERPIHRDYFFYVDITGEPGVRIPPHFHAWHYPMHSRYPTTSWQPGEILRDSTPIVIPEELAAPVQLRLSLRLRDGDSLVPADVRGEHVYSVPLAEFEVLAGSSLPE